MAGLGPTRTGRTRHRTVVTGFLRKKTYVVMQHEVEGFVAQYSAGSIDGEFEKWWVDSKPEWLTETGAANEAP